MSIEKADRAVRNQVDIRVGFRKNGYAQSKVDVRNLSSTGFMIDSAMRIAVGEAVWINLPGLQSILAKVVRVDGFEVGCESKRPVSEAVLDSLIANLQ